MQDTITILGGGAMGTACAAVLARKPDNDVRLWVRNPTFAVHIAETRQNSRLLPGVTLPSTVAVTSSAQEALQNSDYVVLCVPTRGIRDVAMKLKDQIPDTALVVSTAKGIEQDTLIRPSQILQDVLGNRSVVVIGGPCHAEEVAIGMPASVVAACECSTEAERVQHLFSNDRLRVYSNTDLLGVELAAALKNVIAIAAGIGDGLGLGDNARAALNTRGLAEMVRFGNAMGATSETFYGLAGIGDLVVTCGSQHSRNRRVGEMLGRGHSLPEIQAAMSAVAEGVFTAKSIVRIAEQQGIDMPIASEVCQVLFEGKHPREATEELMTRPLREE
jgi:glycerol-3-phosphate dehydrogenase (NAD(P)+)